MARHLELPATGWLRRYRARVHGAVDDGVLAELADGVRIDGVAYGAITATLDRRQGSNAWLTVGLREGKNREVRRVMEYLGLTVTRLIRISFGPFHLGNLAAGAVDEITGKVLREQVRSFFTPTAKPGRRAKTATAGRARADRRRPA